MSERYEIRDKPLKSSTKKFHVLDVKTGREVFHTNDRARAEALIARAGDGVIDQHLKDVGHVWRSAAEEGVNSHRCADCTQGRSRPVKE